MAVYDVTQAPYNANRDGSTDDTQNIQDAIDDCQAADGGVVLIPAGNYLINGLLPPIGSAITIISSSVANPTNINATAHGITDQASAVVAGHSGSTPSINGTHVVTVIDDDNFTIPVNVTVGGTGGTVTQAGDTYRGVSMKTGLHIPEISGIGTDPILGHVQVKGEGKSTRLILGSDDMYGIRISTNYADVKDFTVVGSTTNGSSSAQWEKHQIGIGVAPVNLQDISITRFRGSWNTMQDIAMHNLRIGVHLISGGTSASDCYRNHGTNLAIREVGIGIYFEDNPDSPCKLVIGAITGGPFTLGETITQTGTGATGEFVKATASVDLYLKHLTGTFNDTGLLTGGTSGATTTPSDFAYSPATAINRNTFTNIDIQRAHIGLKVEAADTNSFFHMEINNTTTIGPTIDIVPDGTPTGIHMFMVGPRNNRLVIGNVFVTIPNEANGRDIYLEPGCSQNTFFGFLPHNDTSVIPDDKDSWNHFFTRNSHAMLSQGTWYEDQAGWKMPWIKTGSYYYNHQTDELRIRRSDGTWGALPLLDGALGGGGGEAQPKV